MSQYPNESAALWFERAIVANSVAAAESDKFIAVANLNPTARRVIGKRADDAAAELTRALDAFTAERRVLRGSVDPARTSPGEPRSISLPTLQLRRQQAGGGERTPVTRRARRTRGSHA